MTTAELLAACCGAHGRYTLDKSFRIGEWVYATDGRICVSAPASECPEVGENPECPPADRLPWEKSRKCSEFPLPAQIDRDTEQCDACVGRGTRGRGKCRACAGSGKQPINTPQLIGNDTYADEKYLDIVRRAGATTAWVSKPNKPIYCVCGSATVMIMPVDINYYSERNTHERTQR